MNSEYVLAISVSHNSTAAIMKDGEIIDAVCEERSTRKMNFIGNVFSSFIGQLKRWQVIKLKKCQLKKMSSDQNVIWPKCKLAKM